MSEVGEVRELGGWREVGGLFVGGWLVGWSVGWSVGWLVGWLVGWCVCVFACLCVCVFVGARASVLSVSFLLAYCTVPLCTVLYSTYNYRAQQTMILE